MSKILSEEDDGSEPVEGRHFFESLDRVNRAMHGTNDLAQVMRDVLDASLSIFGCDRAYLLYPCDPDAPFWEIPMERTVPEYPGAMALGVSVPRTAQAARVLRTCLVTHGPVELVWGRGIDPEEEPWKSFQVKSLLYIALYPNLGKPWQFGLQQCSSERRWTRAEKQLFQEISRRLADGLTSLLVYRDLQRSEQFLDNIVENIPNIIFVKDAETLKFVRINKAGEKLFGHPREAIIGRDDYAFFPKAESDFFTAKDREALAAKQLIDIPEETVHGGSADPRILHTKKIPIFDEAGQPQYLFGIAEDITEKRHLEEQLRQAQKLESIGRLAGGVAHDFNNMLGVIIGSVDLALMDRSASPDLRHLLYDIRNAADRSAQLTRQLLAFARKQTAIPKLLDLNEMLHSMGRMLRVLIGERISLKVLAFDDLWSVRIDPSQIDQLVANLCVNARDAIPDIGTITIETRNASFDETYCAHHLEALRGDFVMLAVSDDGKGMDKQTLSKIFEPFFTTKGVGKGTGLGLATVYGIVKQNGGFISVYSEPNIGTTVKLYLPRQDGSTTSMRKDESALPPARGGETVLLVEDEPVILTMVGSMLEKLGYLVIAVAKPADAVQVARQHRAPLHLLITDVIMPEMNGAILASQVLDAHPGVKCLYMSGYTDDVIAHHGVLEEGVSFIHKPFSMGSLAHKVREVLG